MHMLHYKRNCITMMMNSSVLVLLLFSLASLVTLGDAFAEKTTTGWTSRPAVPEIEAQFDPKDKSSEKQKWELGRFVKQSSKFVTLPFASTPTRTILPGDFIWQPSMKGDFTLAPLDDVVMGGVSSSDFDNASGKWVGRVTDANNGGFIGIRSTPSVKYNMEQCKGLVFKFKGGQGKRFKLVVRDSTDFNGICWTTSANVGSAGNPLLALFNAAPETTTVKIPFDSQIPTIFAKTVPDQVFDSSNVVGVQMAYSKFEYDGDLNPNFALGDIELQILEIRAF